jgi:hypothetical protein
MNITLAWKVISDQVCKEILSLTDVRMKLEVVVVIIYFLSSNDVYLCFYVLQNSFDLIFKNWAEIDSQV